MCLLICMYSGNTVRSCSPCACTSVIYQHILWLCAQLRVYYSEVLTGVQSPTQYCTRSYFKVRSAASHHNAALYGMITCTSWPKSNCVSGHKR